MRAHTNNFKNEISMAGKQISGRLYHYLNYNLISEDDDTLITEDNIQLISEQINPSDKELIDEELIYSINFIKNGQLLQSLMKELDFEAKYDLKIGETINAQFGVLVGNDYEYLDYGNYIIYSKEYIAENETWKYVCYDKMLYSMVQYKPLDLIYPCTIRDFLTALANRIGLTFANANDEFVNYNEQVLEELFEGQNITYRDVLDKLSEITASNILINDNDELELGYVNETNDTIDEENLKDINVNFGEVFGPINKVAIIETNDSYEYSAQNDSSIATNGLVQINIIDNIFAFNGHSQEIVENILNKLNDLYYSINDFSTTGVCYYDYLDLFNVNIGENTYKCLLLNNEIKVNQGLEENIYTDKLENIEKESDNYKTSIMNNKDISFNINKQKKEIKASVKKGEVINEINLSEEGAKIRAEKIQLEGYTTINDGFSVDLEGNATMNNATINGGEITIQDIGENQQPNLVLKSTNSNGYVYSGGFDFSNSTENNSIRFYSENTVDPSFDVEIWNDLQFSVRMNGAWSTAYNNLSLENRKKNFEKLENALDIIKQTDIYKYNLKNEDDKAKKHIGLVIGDNFNYSKEITSNENTGVDLYSMISVCFKAIQEQQEQIETLQKQVQDLERKVK